ncbi:MAG: hypothetical protein ACREFO_05090, partial [Acetobacteraceae bacterium]
NGHATQEALQGAYSAAESARQAHSRRVHDATAEQELRMAALSLMNSLPRHWYPERLRDSARLHAASTAA